MQGEYIRDRLLVKIIADICKSNDIALRRFSDDWLLELRKEATTRRILGYKFPLNNSVSAQSAEDKVTAHLILSVQNIPSIPHLLVRSKSTNFTVNTDWNEVVIKPLVGTGGRGVQRFSSVPDALTWIQSEPHQDWAMSPLLTIRREIRLIVLDENVLLSYEKQPVTIHNLKMFNLGLGATAKRIEAWTELIALAQEAQRTLQLRLAAIDIVELEDGQLMVLEVNDGIMMEHYARSSAEYYQQAHGVYSAIIQALF